jgi:hypothetical protein
MFIQRILVGLIIIAAGIITLKFNFQIIGWTGGWDFIDSKLGSGSTYGVLKLLSLLLIVGGLLYATGLLGYLLGPWLRPLAQFFFPRP